MDDNLTELIGESEYYSEFEDQLTWLCQWTGGGLTTIYQDIILGGQNVGLLARLDKNENIYFIDTIKVPGNNSYSFVDFYLNEEDAIYNRNCFARQSFPYNTDKIQLADINYPIAETIYGDWQPTSYNLLVTLNYGENGKLDSLSKGEYTVQYLICDKKNGKILNSVIVDGISGKANLELQFSSEFKNLLQEKIFDKSRKQDANEQFAAVLRGLENEDVTTYIVNHFGNEILSQLEDNGVYFRFPHAGDGYWENYFTDLDNSGFNDHLQKQGKFISDLGLADKDKGFAIVPIKYNEHYVVLAVDCSVNPKVIKMFDSSLYNVLGGSDNKSQAFRDFLLGHPGVLTEDEIKDCEFLLNTLANIPGSLQGNALENAAGKSLGEEYEMGTCGFWALAFCIEAARAGYDNLRQVEGECRNEILLVKTAKRMSAIIDGKDLVSEEQLLKHKIPRNSVCIPRHLKIQEGRSTKYCTELRNMLIEVGPQINSGTGRSTTMAAKQELDNNNLQNLNVLKPFKNSSSQPSLGQQKLEQIPEKPKAKYVEDSHYWRNKFKSDLAKHLPKKGHSLCD